MAAFIVLNRPVSSIVDLFISVLIWCFTSSSSSDSSLKLHPDGLESRLNLMFYFILFYFFSTSSFFFSILKGGLQCARRRGTRQMMSVWENWITKRQKGSFEVSIHQIIRIGLLSVMNWLFGPSTFVGYSVENVSNSYRFRADYLWRMKSARLWKSCFPPEISSSFFVARLDPLFVWLLILFSFSKCCYFVTVVIIVITVIIFNRGREGEAAERWSNETFGYLAA